MEFFFNSLTVIYSSNFDKPQNDDFEYLLRASSGLNAAQFEIICLQNFNEYSLTEIYNMGLRRAKNEVVLFLHNDVKFIGENWGLVLLDKFRNSNFGILGLAGSIEMIRSKQEGAWFGGGELCTAGFVLHPDNYGGMVEEWFSDRQDFIIPCVAIDGVFIAIVKSRINEGFDEQFEGFHYYDVSFCIRNFISGAKLGILCDGSIKLYHNSTGSRNEEWYRNRALFLNKYRGDYSVSPIIDVPRLSNHYSQPPDAVHILIFTNDRNKQLFDCLDALMYVNKYPNLYVWVCDTSLSEKNLVVIREKIRSLNGLIHDQRYFGDTKTDVYNLFSLQSGTRSEHTNHVLNTLQRNGILQTQDFILFMEDSVNLMNDCIASLIELYHQESGVNRIASLGIRIHAKDNKIFHAGLAAEIEKPYVEFSYRLQGHAYRYGGGSPYCDGTTAAFLLVKCKSFLECGGFINAYDDLGYDLAYCLKASIAGYRHLYLQRGVAMIGEVEKNNIGAPGKYRIPQQFMSNRE